MRTTELVAPSSAPGKYAPLLRRRVARALPFPGRFPRAGSAEAYAPDALDDGSCRVGVGPCFGYSAGFPAPLTVHQAVAGAGLRRLRIGLQRCPGAPVQAATLRHPSRWPAPALLGAPWVCLHHLGPCHEQGVINRLKAGWPDGSWSPFPGSNPFAVPPSPPQPARACCASRSRPSPRRCSFSAVPSRYR